MRNKKAKALRRIAMELDKVKNELVRIPPSYTYAWTGWRGTYRRLKKYGDR